jgi:hypothetical protein
LVPCSSWIPFITVDLGYWDLGSNFKDNIDTSVKGKQLLVEAADFLPWTKEAGGSSIVIEAAATMPGFIIVLKSFSSLVKFMVSIAAMTVMLSFVFAYAEQHSHSVEAFRGNAPQSDQLLADAPDPPWGRTHGASDGGRVRPELLRPPMLELPWVPHPVARCRFPARC